MQKKKNTILAIVCIAVIVIIGACYGTYFYWTNRGDQVLFSSDGQYGWGPSPLYSLASREGGKLRIGTVYSFGFVRDVHAIAALEAQFKGSPGGGAPGGAPGGARPAGGAPGGHAHQ